MAAMLRGNYMNSGSAGADPSGLTTNEYDGYLILDDGDQAIHLAWHVLPRQAAEVKVTPKKIPAGASPAVFKLDNKGAGIAQNDAYACWLSARTSLKAAWANKARPRICAPWVSTPSRYLLVSARQKNHSCGHSRSTPGNDRSI